MSDSDPSRPRAKGHSNEWFVLVLLSLGFFMILLDTTIVNIAVPSILTDLNTSLDSILWVLNGYILVYAVLLISFGRLGDLYGQRNLFIAGLALFTLSSGAAGFAQDTNQLVVARLVQGVGAAMLTPQTLAILTTIFPPNRRGAAFGIWGAVAGLAAVAGPTVGGALVTYANWRWVFFVNVPIGITVIVLGMLYIPDLRPGRRHRLDPVGVVLATAGLFAIVFGLIEGERYSWGTFVGFLSIPMLIGAGVLILIAFVFWEARQPEPMMPLSLFADRNFSVANWVSLTVAFGMLGLFLPLTIFLQSVLGFSAIKAGLTFLPMSLISMPVAPFAGRIADRVGGKYVLMFGLSLFAIGFGLVDLVASVNADWYTFTLPVLVAGVGIGCTFAPLTTVAMRNVKPEMAGAASGVINTMRQLGGVLGSAIIGAVLQNRLATALHDEAVTRAAGLPEPFRSRLVDEFSNASTHGFAIGRGQEGGFQLPPGVPPQVAQQVAHVAHDVFGYGFTDAMRPTLLVGLIVLGVGAASCLGIRRRNRGGRPEALEPSGPVPAH